MSDAEIRDYLMIICNLLRLASKPFGQLTYSLPKRNPIDFQSLVINMKLLINSTDSDSATLQRF